MKNFYISDLHFGHFNIIRHCNRPFSSSEEMDKALIDNWNKVVSDNDTVYILGDFCFSKDATKYLKQLKGKKVLVLGNHDGEISKNRQYYLKSKLIDKICDYLEIRDVINDKSYKVVMCHYPMIEWNGFFRRSIHLYGHIHNNEGNVSFQIMKNIGNAYNVGADILDFTPRTLAEIVKR